MGNVQPVAATGRQGHAATADVPEGKWGTQIVFWAPVVKTVENENGEQEEDRFFFMRTYTVFNVDQVEGLDHLRAGQPDTGEPRHRLPARRRGSGSQSAGHGTSLRYGGGKAFYAQPGLHSDPAESNFESLNEYYGTVFHELFTPRNTSPG